MFADESHAYAPNRNTPDAVGGPVLEYSDCRRLGPDACRPSWRPKQNFNPQLAPVSQSTFGPLRCRPLKRDGESQARVKPDTAYATFSRRPCVQPHGTPCDCPSEVKFMLLCTDMFSWSALPLSQLDQETMMRACGPILQITPRNRNRFCSLPCKLQMPARSIGHCFRRHNSSAVVSIHSACPGLPSLMCRPDVLSHCFFPPLGMRDEQVEASRS